MDPLTLGVGGFVTILILLMARVPIAFALGSVAVVCTLTFYSWPVGGEFDIVRGWKAAAPVLTSNTYDFVHSFELIMLPLFIGLSHLAFHSRITTDIYYAMRLFLARIPGGLAIASIMGCGGFSAITGSSVACAAAMGRICTPEMLQAGYGRRLATSSVAVGGTLGSLIPPSVPFILYGIFTEQSISKLFMAGILPGLISLVAFIIVVVVWVKANPAEAPVVRLELKSGDRRRAAFNTWPAILLFGIICIGIFGGFITTTEAAAISVVVATIIGVALKRLTYASFIHSLRETAYQTAMIFLIAFGAKIFVSFISLTGVAPWLIAELQGANLSNWMIIGLITIAFLILGMFLDPIGILLLTLPITVPLVDEMGYNLIWFGVIVVKLLEIGLITPPVGLNAFVVKSVIDRDIPVHTIFAGISRFLIAEVIVLGLLLGFPILSLLLPDTFLG